MVSILVKMNPKSIFKLEEKYRNHVVWEYYYLLGCLSDKQYLYKTWIEQSVVGIIDSYADTYSNLFEGLIFNYFVDHDVKKLGFGKELIEKLQVLRDLLESYYKKNPYYPKWIDDKVLKDPEWDIVINKAKKVISLWRNDVEASKFIDMF